MVPLGQALRGLHAEPVDEELLGELAVLLERLDPLRDLRADGDALERNDVALAGVDRAVEVGKADAVVLGLAREGEPLDLRVVILRVEDHEVVAVRVAREVAKAHLGLEVVLLGPHALELRREALVAVVALDDAAPVLALLAAPAPVELEEDVAVEVWIDLVEVDVHVAEAPERRLGDLGVGPDVRAHRVVGRGRRVVDDLGLLAELLGLVADLRDKRLARLVVDQRIDCVEARRRRPCSRRLRARRPRRTPCRSG